MVTSLHAQEILTLMKKVIATHKYNNFDLITNYSDSKLILVKQSSNSIYFLSASNRYLSVQTVTVGQMYRCLVHPKDLQSDMSTRKHFYRIKKILSYL